MMLQVDYEREYMVQIHDKHLSRIGVRMWLLRAHCEVWYGVDAETIDGCMQKDNPELHRDYIQ